jgi:4-diphosphocytidyl-2-C-methyl-D-erythritol kinase
MVAVSLYDTLVCKADASGAVRLQCNLPNLSTDSENLVMRAALLLQQQTGCRQGAELRLVKRIPLAGGLAGGSSDAAAALAGLNLLWRLGLTHGALTTLAAALGSDVPFFFAPPAAWCTGRGEQVTPLPLGRPLLFVLACPPAGLSTAVVYQGVKIPASPETGTEIRRALALGEVEEIGRRLHNRLQPAAERLYTAVADLQARLDILQPAGARMSGSGSTLFALCRDRNEARRIAQELRHGPEDGLRPQVYLVRSCG